MRSGLPHVIALLGPVLAMGAASSAAGQEVAVRASGTPAASGTYQGVCPGTDHPPAVGPAPGAAGKNVITWPGFQMLPNGGSRVFVQSTGPISTSTETVNQTLRVSLGPARFAHRNNARPLITRFFNTPVVEASIKIAGGKAVLELQLRDRVQPTIRSEVGDKSGYHFVYVDFPPGEYIEPARPVANAMPSTLPPAAPDELPPAPDGSPDHLSGGASASGSVRGSASTKEGKAKAEGRAKGKLSIGF